MPKVLSLAWETILEIGHAFEDKHLYINTPSWDRPTICYYDDDNEDCTIAITPILSTEEPYNSLSMGDEHLDTILETELDELIKSSVENLVPIPSESEGIPDNMCDIDDDSFSIDDIEYVEASPPDSELISLEVMEIIIPEVGWINEDILLTIKDDILREKLFNINLLVANIEALKDNPTSYSDFMTKSSSTSLNFLLEETNTYDNSLPESKTFCFNLEEISSGSTTTRSDISLLNYEGVIFMSSPMSSLTSYLHRSMIVSPLRMNLNRGMDVVEDTFPTREPRVYVPNVLPTHPMLQLNLDFILFSESLFAYVVWIFLPFLSYSVSPQYLLSFGNEDTIFDPGISICHSFMPDVSHGSETFIKFNVYPKHLNGSLMEILFSTP
nr:hypothetical protein [Tanacetum cinerariifolium]